MIYHNTFGVFREFLCALLSLLQRVDFFCQPGLAAIRSIFFHNVSLCRLINAFDKFFVKIFRARNVFLFNCLLRLLLQIRQMLFRILVALCALFRLPDVFQCCFFVSHIGGVRL